MNINTLIQSAFENHQKGNLKQAEHLYKEILKKQPDNPDVLHLLGLVFCQLANYDLAIRYFRRALKFNPVDVAVVYCNFGIALQGKGLMDEAIIYYQKALQLQPSFAKAYCNLGVAFREKGQFDKAITHYQKALELNPNLTSAHYNLGVAFLKKGQVDKAVSFFQKALKLTPNHTASLNNLGNCLKDKGKVNEAIICYQKAIKTNPDFAESFNNLGIALQEQHHLDEAISCFQKAIQLNPNYFEAYNNMGNVFIVQGKLNEGMNCFKQALKLKPTYPKALLNLVRNQSLNYDDSKELFELTKDLIKQDMSEDDKIDVYFAMGKLCENLKLFEKSLKYYRFGNALKRAQVEFNIDSHVAYLSRIQETFSADFIEHRKSWGSVSQMPIFIFGMPRSGTTLVEQIIASHPNVYGGGELQFFNQMDQKLASIIKVNELRYPECLNFSGDQAAYDMAELYIKEIPILTGQSKDYTRITDKNPFNFYHLGLISLLFPKASFIHCQRNPLDTCISIYFQNFSQGNQFAYDLSELGQYYFEYLKLMNHWRKVLPICIFELRYEDIIQQQEEVSRKLIEFCGLAWDSACLDFYKKERPVFTASNWQVRQPIYTTSCGRWKNYEQFLDPLKKLLADFI